MKKMVFKTKLEDEKGKRRMLKAITAIEGVDSVSVDMKENKVTVIGETDPVSLSSKLRKFGSVDLLSVGPAKEVKVGSAEEVKVGSAKEEKKEGEKSHSDAKSTPQISYRPFEYTVASGEETNACVIS